MVVVVIMMTMMMIWLAEGTYSLTWDPNHGRYFVYATCRSLVVVVGSEGRVRLHNNSHYEND
jgi:hypothetical protein